MGKAYRVKTVEDNRALFKYLSKKGYKWYGNDELNQEDMFMDAVGPCRYIICEDENEKLVGYANIDSNVALDSEGNDESVKAECIDGKLYLDGSCVETFDGSIYPDYYKQNGHDLFDHFTEIMPTQGFRGFMIGNIFKYVTRYPAKNGVEDLCKARTYLNRLIEFEKDMEGEANDTTKSNS